MSQKLVVILFLFSVQLPMGMNAGTLDSPEAGDIGSPVYAGRPFNAASEFKRYRRKAYKLKRNVDKSEYDKDAMLQLLRNAGVFEKLPHVGSTAERSFRAEFRPFEVRIYAGLWRWPLRAGFVSSEFKWRWGRMHEGLDIAADRGVPVRASAPGRVLYAGNGISGYGNVVILRHDQNTTSLYAHNERLAVRAGDSVGAGQIIAFLGSTGRSTGPHVHFEIRRLGHPMNPRGLLVRGRF